ncbi:MAG: ARMT1-like domain-containing protein [Clostridia bacterium]|nr:ARMT1-like domain-containing protein [Clostridia bacterium]MDD4048087.1 ARMT1-like domain-containing protein [Clostridia bacterium]
MDFKIDCVPCLTRQTVESLRINNTTSEIDEDVMKLVLKKMFEFDYSKNPIHMSATIHRLIRNQFKSPDPYKEIKNKFNKAALDLYNDLEKMVNESPHPFDTAIRIATSGNIIDFGINSNISIENVKESIQQALENKFYGNTTEELENAVQHAKKILYLGDNCGEIVFDKLLIKQLPLEKITFVVRGKPIINDALIEDAVFAGITELVPVIDNGSDVPGTIPELCSEQFNKEFNSADLVISKGQGNYECLNDYDKDNMFFLFKVKCNRVANKLGCHIGDVVMKKNR